MQNEFEKQVQQKMEELKLTPSEPVWQKVEEQIRKKKDKKRLIFLLLLLGLLIGADIWWMSSSRGHVLQRKNEIVSNNLPKNSKANEPNSITKNSEVEIRIDSSISKVQKHVANTEKRFSSSVNEKANSFIHKQNLVAVNNKTKTLNNSSFTNSEKADVAKVEENTSNVFPEQENKPKEFVSKNEITSVKKDSTTHSNAIDSTKTEMKNPADSSAKKKIVTNHKKWKSSIILQLGWSDYSSLQRNNSLAATSFSTPGTTSGVGASYFSPQKTSAGIAFALGTAFKKSLGKRMNVSVGVQYHFYSSQNKVGQKIQRDTVLGNSFSSVHVSNYYTNGTQNQFTNKFSFIEVPVTLYYQLFKNFPLHFSVGASYGHLLKTNALSFNYSYNIYYYDKANIVQNYVNAFSSLQYQIPSKSHLKVQVGPVVQYNFSKLKKENLYNTPHLFFGGLKTGINF